MNMALYHFSLGHIKRTTGHTAIAAAAYRSGEKLYDAFYGETQDYSRKKGVITSMIYAPDYVPERLHDRQTLWTEVEYNENRKDAQLAYSFDIALQNELTMKENIELLDTFVREEMVPLGMIVDVAIHDPDKGKHGIPNPHGHLTSPIRPFLESGMWGDKQHQEYVLDENGEKIRKTNGKYKTMAVSSTGWNDPALLEHWRRRWAELVNAKFEEKGLSCRVDHRSNEKRGIDEIPQVHEGSAVRRMEARGIVTEKGSWNRWVKKTNDAIRRILSVIREISDWMKEMREEIRRLEEPTVADMVMKYYDHRNEVALTYDHGIHTAQKTNLKQMNKDCNYLMSNGITTSDELEELIKKKKDAVSQKEGVIKDKRAKVKEYRDRLKSLDNYEKYKPVFEESQRNFFKSKNAEFQKAHRNELNQYHKAKRELDPYLVDGSMEAARELWNEKIDTLKAEITEDLKDEDLTLLKDEIAILKDIKKAIEFCVNPNGSSGEGSNDGGEEPAMLDNNSEAEQQKKQAEEQAQAAARQMQSEQLARQNHQSAQKKPTRERASIHGKMDHYQKQVDAYKAEHYNTPGHKREETNLS
ncbi:MAG: MobA/MobL family protein [Lachnospiraceae bacterium]|nr:MobA/MobL family protein [Lachnospiraceae bacterium]